MSSSVLTAPAARLQLGQLGEHGGGERLLEQRFVEQRLLGGRLVGERLLEQRLLGRCELGCGFVERRQLGRCFLGRIGSAAPLKRANPSKE
jgi:hypothetical protein